jgi:plastocyanin
MTKWLLPTTMVAVLALAPGGLAWAKEHKVEITDRAFKPAKIKIKKGDTVVWTNNGEGDHTVTSTDDDDAESFDSGKIAVGGTFEHTFGEAGKFEYKCDYHTRMKGVVEVSE